MKVLSAAIRGTSLFGKLRQVNRHAVTVAGAAALLGGCAVIPEVSEPTTTASTPVPEPVETVAVPPPSALPTDTTRHRVALLVPLSGSTSAVGQSLANATTMALVDGALIDENANNLRITTYDTAKGADAAVRQAIADGNRLILGPLLAENVPAVRAVAGPAGIPAVSFSNDTSVASADVLVMGHIPEQSINRTVEYARANGRRNFAALLPEGDYGRRSFSALTAAVSEHGGRLSAYELYSRSNTSIISAAQRLRTKGGYDTVLIADGARLAAQAAGELKRGSNNAQLMGTELWSGEGALTRTSSFNGALYSAVSNGRFKRFSDSYEKRFGTKPYRIATLGYDSVLLTLRVARDWQIGSRFPKSLLFGGGGFVGVDGPFRFSNNGVVERALEVRKVEGNRVVEVDPAPAGFVTE